MSRVDYLGVAPLLAFQYNSLQNSGKIKAEIYIICKDNDCREINFSGGSYPWPWVVHPPLRQNTVGITVWVHVHGFIS